MVVFHHHEDRIANKKDAFNTAFLVSVVANGIFVLAQITAAFMANSTGLLADAIHNLGDVLSLILAWVGNLLLKRSPTSRSTYGMKKTSILAALANGVLLIFTCGIIVSEVVYKFFFPSPVQAITVMIVAGIGIIINAATAALFWGGWSDLNIRAAFLHLVYDALVSVGVVLSAVLLYWTGWLWIDPLMGLIIAIIIFKGTWSLFVDSFRLIIDGVPRDISITKVRQLIEEQPGVKGVHDLHVWALSTQENALSVHVWMPDEPFTDTTRQALSHRLRAEYNIHHTTIQVEYQQNTCEDACVTYLF